MTGPKAAEEPRDSGDLFLRRAALSECGLLTELCVRSKAMWGYDRDFMEKCRTELTVDRCAVESGLLRVAARGELIVGIAELSFAGDEAEIEKLFVDPAASGAGVGRLLMRWAVDAAKTAGAKKLVIDSDPNAAAFYRRIGAVDAGHVASASIPGRMLPRLVIDLSG